MTKTFRATCVKNNTKIDVIIHHETIEGAKAELHQQEYSIIEIKEVEDALSKWPIFYFDINVNGEIKTGQIGSTDILKAYIHLVDKLQQNIVAIYDQKEDSEDKKRITTFQVKSSYDLYRKQNKLEKEVVKETVQEKNQKDEVSDKVLKEVQKYQEIIEKIIKKIEVLMLEKRDFITQERWEKLRSLIGQLRQVKNTTNFDRLRLICEGTLLKIGEIEAEIALKNNILEKKEYLEDTNSLLKNIGSDKNIQVAEDGDLGASLLQAFKASLETFRVAISSSGAEVVGVSVETQNQGATGSFSYYKNLKELDVYKQKLKEVEKSLFKARILFKKELVARLTLRRKLILQNIAIIQKRLGNSHLSYSQIVRGAQTFINLFLLLARALGNALTHTFILISIGYLLGIFATYEAFSYQMMLLGIAAIVFRYAYSLTVFIPLLIFGGASIYTIGVNF